MKDMYLTRRMLLAASLMIAAALVAGCSGTTTKGPAPGPTTFRVTANLVDSITGAPVSGATVTLAGNGQTATGQSDSNGNVDMTVSGSLTGAGTVTISSSGSNVYGPVAVTFPSAGNTLALGQLSVNQNGLPPPPPL